MGEQGVSLGGVSPAHPSLLFSSESTFYFLPFGFSRAPFGRNGEKNLPNINHVFFHISAQRVVILLGNVQTCDWLEEREERKKNIVTDLSRFM